MEYVKVYTADNHWQHIEVLKRNRKKRSAYGRFFVEGVRAVNQMAAHNWRVYAWIYADGRRLSTWAQDILSKVPSEKHFILAPELMEQLSDKEDTSELWPWSFSLTMTWPDPFRNGLCWSYATDPLVLVTLEQSCGHAIRSGLMG